MKKLSFAYIVLASILWGTSAIFVHYLAPYGFTSIHMTFMRSIVALAAIGGYILFCDKKLFKANLKELLLFAGSGISFFCTASCYYYSMQITSVSTAVVLMYTAPVFVMIYSVAFLGEKLTKIKLVAVISMLIGCALVSGVIGGIKFNVFGILIGFMSGISYSAYNIFTKIEMRNRSNPLTATFYCFLFAAAVGVFASNPTAIPGCISDNPSLTIPLAVGMGVCTCIMPYFLYTLALKHVPAGTATALGIIEPMSATIFSILLFNEKPGIPSFCGMFLILGAVFLLSKYGTEDM